jgi:hypothetical protein
MNCHVLFENFSVEIEQEIVKAAERQVDENVSHFDDRKVFHR